nr:MAG TPA: hypothetical protein [Caudoviricetes sp.]
MKLRLYHVRTSLLLVTLPSSLSIKSRRRVLTVSMSANLHLEYLIRMLRRSQNISVSVAVIKYLLMVTNGECLGAKILTLLLLLEHDIIYYVRGKERKSYEEPHCSDC